MEKLFENILDVDEKIEKVFKPQKTKYFVSTMLRWFFVILSFTLMGVLMIVFPDEGMNVDLIYLLIPIGVFVLGMLIVLLFASIHYKNLYYAYTNKRVIIRSGIFGVDFKTSIISRLLKK